MHHKMMLYTLGRAAVKRVIAGGPQSTNRALRRLLHLQRVDPSLRPDFSSSRRHALFISQRSYATATKAASMTKSQSSTDAKPKAKRTPAKEAVKKSTKAPAKRGRPASKKPAKKPVKKPVRAKKELTEEQKERALIKKLKATALSAPTMKPKTAWTVFASDHLKESKVKVSAAMSEISTKFKALTSAELESLNHTANQNAAANDVLYKEWIESHTPDQIRIANNARWRLKRILKRTHVYPIIQDSRLPKRPVNARAIFTRERYASGDLKSIKFGEAAKLLVNEWNSLSASERKSYEDRALEDTQRYVQEFKTVYHKDSTSKVQT